jgi:hypothetical protein
MTDQILCARNFDKSSDPYPRRHHRSMPSASFRYPPHGPDVPTPARDPSRQASLHLDFLIIGGGLFHVSDTLLYCLQPTCFYFNQELPGLLRRTRSRHRATALECLSRQGVYNSDQGVYDYLPMQPKSYHTGESRRNLHKRPRWPRRLLSWIVSVPHICDFCLRRLRASRGGDNTNQFGLLCLKVKTGRSIGQSAWQGALIEEMGSSYLTVHVSP